MSKTKKLILSISIPGAVLLLLAGVWFYFYLNRTTALQNALAARDAEAVSNVYHATENPGRIREYDALIAETLDEILIDLNAQNFAAQAETGGKTVPYRYLADTWGSLVYNESDRFGAKTLQDSISESNAERWARLNALLDSKSAYCAGVSLAQKDPKQAIGLFQSLSEQDSAFSDAQKRAAECAKVILNQTVAEAGALAEEEQFDEALAALDEVERYLDDRALTSEELKQTLADARLRILEQKAAAEEAARLAAEEERRRKEEEERLAAEARKAAAAALKQQQSAQSAGVPYYLVVNRAQNLVIVYSRDDAGEYTVPCKAMVCSVGLNGKTPTGTFLTSDKYVWRALVGGVYGQYATRITGSILFHSVPYYSRDKGDLEKEEYNKLGDDASLGCVRLCVADAKWIYDNCPSGTKVTIYDGYDAEPLAKPSPIRIDPDDERSGWDPTDPDPENPWRA